MLAFDWESHGVFDHFRELQRADHLTDLTFVCADGRVRAHQLLLARHSTFLAQMVKRFLVAQEYIPFDLCVSLPDVSMAHLQLVLDFMYLGTLKVSQGEYAHFRAVCHLLDLQVPIADFDEFFCGLTETADHVEVPEAEPEVEEPSYDHIPAQVFVCDECYAIFPLKIALQRHRRRKHPPIAHPNQPGTSPVQTGLGSRKRKSEALEGSEAGNLVATTPTGRPQATVPCPDCARDVAKGRAREHLAQHLRHNLKQLCEDATTSGRKKCIECDYESPTAWYVGRHAGLSHSRIHDFASEAQMAFLKAAGALGKHGKRREPVDNDGPESAIGLDPGSPYESEVLDSDPNPLELLAPF